MEQNVDPHCRDTGQSRRPILRQVTALNSHWPMATYRDLNCIHERSYFRSIQLQNRPEAGADIGDLCAPNTVVGNKGLVGSFLAVADIGERRVTGSPLGVTADAKLIRLADLRMIRVF